MCRFRSRPDVAMLVTSARHAPELLKSTNSYSHLIGHPIIPERTHGLTMLHGTCALFAKSFGLRFAVMLE